MSSDIIDQDKGPDEEKPLSRVLTGFGCESCYVSYITDLEDRVQRGDKALAILAKTHAELKLDFASLLEAVAAEHAVKHLLEKIELLEADRDLNRAKAANSANVLAEVHAVILEGYNLPPGGLPVQ